MAKGRLWTLTLLRHLGALLLQQQLQLEGWAGAAIDTMVNWGGESKARVQHPTFGKLEAEHLMIIFWCSTDVRRNLESSSRLRFHACNFVGNYPTPGLGTSTVVIWFVQLMPWKAVSTCQAKSLEPLPPAIHPAFLAVLVGLPLPLPQTGNAKKAPKLPKVTSPKSLRNKQKWLQLSKTSAMGIDKQFKCATLWSRIRAAC